jgi:hypothetical protein
MHHAALGSLNSTSVSVITQFSRLRKFVLRWAVQALAWALTSFSLHADTHIYGGAFSTNLNGKLFFSNGPLFDATRTNFALPQVLRTNGLNAGHYRGDALTFSALPGTVVNGGPVPGHAAFGSLLAIQVATVKGPPGGSFAFWEGDGESDLGVITFSVPVGETNGSNYFVISQSFGQPGTDPYGHIHGRQVTTSLPGIYLVGFQVIDVSTNGAGGGPIHAPSDIMEVRFQAGGWIEALQLFTNRVTASFRSPPGISNLLERAESISSTNWQPVALPIRGNNFLQAYTDTNAPTENRFYRIRQLNNLP